MANKPSATKEQEQPEVVKATMLDETLVQVEFVAFPGEYVVYSTDWSWQEKRKFHKIQTEEDSLIQILKWMNDWHVKDTSGELLATPKYYLEHLDELNLHVRKVNLLLRSVYAAFNCASELP